MRILLIGGNGFIGAPLALELHAAGQVVAILHRSAEPHPGDDVMRIKGDRNRLSESLGKIQRFSPQIIVDLVLSSGKQALELRDTARRVATMLP